MVLSQYRLDTQSLHFWPNRSLTNIIRESETLSHESCDNMTKLPNFMHPKKPDQQIKINMKFIKGTKRRLERSHFSIRPHREKVKGLVHDSCALCCLWYQPEKSPDEYQHDPELDRTGVSYSMLFQSSPQDLLAPQKFPVWDMIWFQ